MTKEETKEAIKVMQAYVDGKEIETTELGGWKQCDCPSWDWYDNFYRIKNEPKYVPYDNIEEIFNDAFKHGWYIIEKNRIFNNSKKIFLSDSTVIIGDSHFINDYNFLFNKITWKDGTPFGKKIMD